MQTKCKHNFVKLNIDIPSASETIDIEVCDICCFTRDEITLQQAEIRERQLQAKNHNLELSIAAVRAANRAWETIVAELREEIKELKTIWQ